MSVTVYCIVGNFTRHLLFSLYSDAMYRTLLQFLYQIFSFLLLFCCFFLDVAGKAFLYWYCLSFVFLDVFKMFFVCFCFMNLEISSQKRTERRECSFCVVKKIVLICFNIIILRHLNKRRVIILCCYFQV